VTGGVVIHCPRYRQLCTIRIIETAIRNSKHMVSDNGDCDRGLGEIWQRD
ncbi:hypothetical protein COCMIDRAFT_109118, partial [Bipolaris oryzae ATCC 44560]